MPCIDAFYLPSFSAGASLCRLYCASLLSGYLPSLVYFQLLQGRSGRRKNRNLPIGNVPDTAQEAVLLVVGGYPVESYAGQRQNLVGLAGVDYALVAQIFESVRRIADIDAAHVCADSHQNHACTHVERQFQVDRQRS